VSSICVVGLGYIGLPLAIAAQTVGHNVVGLDIDIQKVKGLNEGRSHIEDISEREVAEALIRGFKPSQDFSLIGQAEIVILCVPTPLSEDLKPDLSFLIEAMTEVAHHAKPRTLIINESTSAPGTVRTFLPGIASKVDSSKELLFAVAPERIDPNNKIWNFRNTPRLLGAVTQEALNRSKIFYESFCSEVLLVSSPEIAELAKLLENSYRLVNIALVNEIAKLTSKIEVPLSEVITAASSKPYGFQAFYPGLGAGGHCIPVDPLYLANWASDHKSPISIIELASGINRGMVDFVADKLRPLKSKFDSKILVLGITYKSGVADIRESPAIRLIDKLESEGWKVDWWDPLVTNLSDKKGVYSQNYDCIVISNSVSNEWALKQIQNAKYVFDCTGQLSDFSHVYGW
jgi:UDP-N-acetyl-D-glucosamine dehydrogenase